MIRLVIDTNNLPRNLTSPSTAFSRVVQLVNEGVVQILMPHVIAEEWRTQQLEHMRKQCEKASQALAELVSGGHLNAHPQHQALVDASTAVTQTAANLEVVSHSALQRLLETLQTQTIPITDEHGGRVLAAYFRGGPPFSGLKARKDFPDAYQFEAISDLAGDAGSPLAVVTADKNLSRHVAALPETTCYDSLGAFAQSDAVRELTAAIHAETAWRAALPAVVDVLRQHEAQILDPDFVNSFVDAVAGEEVEHSSIPSDNSDATVSMVDDPADMEIDWDEAEDFGPGVLRVPFTCSTEVLLDFDVYYADAYGQPEYVRVQWNDPDERKYFDAQANAHANVAGHLTIKVDNWQAHVNPADAEVSVDDIEKVALQEDEAGNALN